MKISNNFSRRSLLSVAAGSIAAPAILRTGHAWAADLEVVETANGRVRGARSDGLTSFKGIPYAADTSGRNRFMAPRPVESWAGVRPALAFGARCPQAPPPPGAPSSSTAATFSEDCCVLNVYSPNLNPQARLPVMFWIHGGGFSGGAGEVDGANLARFGDVVVVAINHRLNIFGYASLANLSEEFQDSGNVGQLDLLQALRWVKTNIGAFGGDPDNVTVFGESGGGSKIMTMGVMPGSTGLFRRSINMSGNGAVRLKPPADAEPTINELLRVLGIDRRDARKLQDLPADQLFGAYRTAITNLHTDQLRPVVDGRNILWPTMSPEGLKMQAKRPGILSTTATEAGAFLPATPDNVAITTEQLNRRIMKQYGLDQDRAAAVIEGYRQENPRRTPWEILLTVSSEAIVRGPMRRAAEALSGAQARVYFMDFNYLVDPVRGAPHASDIPYAFGIQATGRNAKTGADAAAVAHNEMATFVAFSKTGDPNNPNIPIWTPYQVKTRPTLVMEEHARVVEDFRRSDRLESESLPALTTFEVEQGPLIRGGV